MAVMKSLEFVGSSLDDLREFPVEARRAAGFELGFVQRGLDPSDWKPMNEVGTGVREIRIHVLGEWRVLYVANSPRRSMCFMCSRRKRRELEGKTLS
jgi:phage-related protein